MITKKELIIKLNEAAITEENAVIIYTQHLKTILPWSGLNIEDQNEIRNLLDTLANDSKVHKKTFMLLKEKVEKDKRDVF